MAGYIRQSTFVDGDTITAALFNNEYNQLVNAFSNTSGHKHDGTTAEGPVIGLIGDAGETSPNNKVLIDTTNNYIEFYVEVSSAPVQQLYIADGAIIPVTDSDIDLGTTSLRFKDTYTDTVTTTGNVSIGGDLTVTGSATISGNLTFGDADTDSINLAAEIDSDIIPNTDGTYDLGSATKEWQDLYIDGTANIDSLVADTADINGGTIDGATIATSDITVGAGKTLNVSAGALTLADNQISGDKVEGGTIAATTITTLTSTTGNITNVNATTVDSTNLEVTNLKAKDGTAAGSIANSTGVVTLASSVLTTTDINGGTIDGVTIGGTTAGAVTFTDLSDGTITIAGFADEDNMVSNSATLVPTQQSVKAYVDSQVTAQDLDFQGDTGGALSIDLDSESLTIAGGTGIDTSGATNTLTVAIDSTVATLTGTQTLTNKTLTTPVISSISNTGTLTLPTSTDTLVGRATTDTLTNKTLTSPDINTPDIDGGTIDGTVIGGATPAAADFTTMDTTGNASVGGNLSVTGDLTINGTTTTVNSTTVTIDDPIFTLGGDTAPASDDNKDRGIEFKWHNGTAAKVGFFGYDDSASVFTFIPDATNTSEVFSGSAGNVAFGNIAGTLTTAAQPNITSVGTLTGLTTTGDINFGDNDKAVFGAGSDLQIYHDGTNSIIKDVGTGDLNIFAADNLRLLDTNSKNWLYAAQDAEVRLYYNSNEKLATTSTGIDVTGSVTADGLTVDGDTDFVHTTPSNISTMLTVRDNRTTTSEENYIFALTRQNSATTALYLGNNDSNNAIIAGNNTATLIGYDVSGTFTPSAKFNNNGDISFYDDTGTSQALFWDASAESLGIGTTSPNFKLENTTTADIGNNTEYTTTRYAFGRAATPCYITAFRESFSSTSSIVFHSNSNEGTSPSEKMRIDSSGNVGIGTTIASTYNAQLASFKDGGSFAYLGHNNTGGTFPKVSALSFGSNAVTHTHTTNGGTVALAGSAQIAAIQSASSNAVTDMAFYTTSGGSVTEKMRIDSSGNVLVGNTVTNPASGFSSQKGFAYTNSTGQVQIATTANGDALQLGRNNTNDGSILTFRKESNTVGSIGNSASNLYIADNSDTGLRFDGAGTDNILPCNSSGATRDNAIDLGTSAARFNDIYATNGTIQTSDRNEKQDIEALTDAETRVAVAAKGLLRKFRWKSAVEEKGDEARIHFGIIAQDLQDAFTAEGLDAGDYAMFISSTWTDDDGVEQTRLGVRYSELLAFIIAAI